MRAAHKMMRVMARVAFLKRRGSILDILRYPPRLDNGRESPRAILTARRLMTAGGHKSSASLYRVARGGNSRGGSITLASDKHRSRRGEAGGGGG